jgi:hypothetical protein
MQKYIIYLVLLNALLTTGLVLLWNLIFVGVSPSWVGVGLALLFVYELIVIVITEKKRETVTPRQSVNLFLGLKVGKIILSLLFIAIYAIASRVELKRFILVFVALYLVYLLFDTIYLARGEKRKSINN